MDEVVIGVVLDGMDLTDTQWTILAPVLPRRRVRRDPRDVLNNILQVLRTGAPWQTALVFLSPITIASAFPHETQLVEHTLHARFLPDKPERLIGDAAYDSDPLERAVAACEIELIAPHRRARSPPDARRPLRRSGSAGASSDSGAWPQNSRRMVTRYERRSGSFLASFTVRACALILLRHL